MVVAMPLSVVAGLLPLRQPLPQGNSPYGNPTGPEQKYRRSDELPPGCGSRWNAAGQHRIVGVGALVEVQRRRVGDLVLHPLVQQGPKAPRSRQPRHPDDLLLRVLPLANPVLRTIRLLTWTDLQRAGHPGKHLRSPPPLQPLLPYRARFRNTVAARAESGSVF